MLAERIAMRLAGRARCAARLDVTIGDATGERVVTVTPVRDRGGALSTAEQLAEAIGSALGDSPSTAWRLRVVVTGEALAGDAPDVELVEAPTQRTFAALPGMLEQAGEARTGIAIGAGSAADTPRAPAAAASAGASTSEQRGTVPQPNPAFALAAAPSRVAANDDGLPRRGAQSLSNNAPHVPAHAAAHEQRVDVRGVKSAAPSTPAPRSGRTTSKRSAGRAAEVTGFAIADADVALSIALSTSGSSVDRVFGLTSPGAFGERRDGHRRTRQGKQRRRTPAVAAAIQPRLFKT